VASAAVCPEPPASYSDDELMKPFVGGVASDTLVPDASTGRVPVGAIAAHVASLSALKSDGALKPRPIRRVGSDIETDMDTLVANDAALYNKLSEEYCYYEGRYRFALKKFLTLATSRNPTDNGRARALLENTRRLNIRVNSLLEIMNYLAQERVVAVNANKADINSRTAVLNTRLADMRKGYAFLSSENAVITAQKEMVRYTEEKNNYTSNQIALWTAANIVALGVIFYVYRS
jgi:hypothetical protein